MGNAQSITVSSAAGLFPNENIWVDTGANAEAVTIGSINTSTKVITLETTAIPNTSGLSIASCVRRTGLSSGYFPGRCPGAAMHPRAQATRHCVCWGISTTMACSIWFSTIVRKREPTRRARLYAACGLLRHRPSWVTTNTPVLDNVTSCQFSYTYTANLAGAADPTPTINNVINAPDNPNGTASTVQANRFTLSDGVTLPQFVVSIGITLTTCSQSGISETQSLYDRSGTGANTICLSKSFLNIQPRNVLAGYYRHNKFTTATLRILPRTRLTSSCYMNFQPLPPASQFPAGNP